MKAVRYNDLSIGERIIVREQYIEDQNDLCMYCKKNIHQDPPKDILKKKINWKLFPPNFLKYPIHLQRS